MEEIQVKNGLDTVDGRHQRFNTIMCEFRTHNIISRTPRRFTFVSVNCAVASVPIIIKDGLEKSEAPKARCRARELVTIFAFSRD